MIKKLKTKDEIKSKKKKNQLLIGSIMIFIMVLSTAGYAIFNTGSDSNGGENLKSKYNGIEFVMQNDMWTFQSGQSVFYFQNLPQDVENVSISGLYDLKNYADKPLYFVNNYNLASTEILQNIGSIVPRKQEACLAGLNCSNKDLPVKNCSNDNLVVFYTPEVSSLKIDNKVYQEGNCVYIEGDFVKGADRFLYKILGIS